MMSCVFSWSCMVVAAVVVGVAVVVSTVAHIDFDAVNAVPLLSSMIELSSPAIQRDVVCF